MLSFAELVGACCSIMACSTMVPSQRRPHKALDREVDKEVDSACETDVLPDGRVVPSESSFGWHHMDLSKPLPPLTELSQAEHPIGLRGGKRVYLCTARQSIKYAVVERSCDFSKHYGTSMYICQRA